MEDKVSLEFMQGKRHLIIHAFRGPTAALRSPITGQMTGKVNESLQAKVEVTLFESEKQIWTSTGTSAGLEVAGDTTILESDSWRK